MKPLVYLRLALLFPYVLWVILLLLMRVLPGMDSSLTLEASAISRSLEMLPMLYVLGILFWFVPYTLLALTLVMWSRQKQAHRIVRVFALSPIMLTALMLLEINVLSVAFDDPALGAPVSGFSDLMSLNLLAVLLTLGAGYFCVALGFGLYKLLQRLNILRASAALVEPAMIEG